jgi:hypothetical protein
LSREAIRVPRYTAESLEYRTALTNAEELKPITIDDNPQGGSAQFGRVLPDYKRISKAATVIHFAIAVGTTGLTPAVLLLLEPYRSIAEIALLTAPLTASAAIISVMALRRSFARMRGSERLGVFVPAVLLPYFTAKYFGLVLPAPRLQVPLPFELIPFNLWPVVWAWTWVVSILTHYLSLYGLVRTLLSAACGYYLAWVWVRGIAPRLRGAKSR